MLEFDIVFMIHVLSRTGALFLSGYDQVTSVKNTCRVDFLHKFLSI